MKIALGTGLLAPRGTTNMLVMKYYLRHQKTEARIGELTKIIEDNAWMQHRHSINRIEMDRNNEQEVINLSDEM